MDTVFDFLTHHPLWLIVGFVPCRVSISRCTHTVERLGVTALFWSLVFTRQGKYQEWELHISALHFVRSTLLNLVWALINRKSPAAD